MAVRDPFDEAVQAKASQDGTPRMLFEGQYANSGSIRVYDVTPDGRFLMVREIERPPMKSTHMMLMQNWFDELKRRVPTN